MTKSSGSGNGHKILAAGAAIVAGEIILSHFGGPGLIVGLFAGPAAWVGIENYEDVSGKSLALPSRAPRPKSGRAEASGGKLSLGRRLVTGKSYREAQTAAAAASAPGDSEQATDEEPEEDTYIDEEEPATQDLLDLGWDLRPHVNTFFSKRVSVLGMSGAGKSNFLARLVECLGKYDAPLILFDSKPEYKKLCSRRYLCNAARADSASLTPQNARKIAHQIMEQRLQVVVDLSTYEPEDAALVMIDLALGVRAYQQARLDAGEILIPCTFIVEEAHDWFPEDESQSVLRGIRVDDGMLLSRLQRVYFNLETKGRSYGMGLVTATQRPQAVDKRLISQAEWRFLLKAMEPAELKVYRTYGAQDAQIISLNPLRGEAYVIGPDGSRGVYHIKRRESPDEAPSPGVENLYRAPAATSVPAWERSQREGALERGNASAGTFPARAGTRREQPVEPLPPVPDRRERSQSVPASSGNVPDVGYTPDEEQAVLRAYHELKAANSGEEPSRRAIAQYMGLAGGRPYNRVIRPVCDKYKLSMQNGAASMEGEASYGNN